MYQRTKIAVAVTLAVSAMSAFAQTTEAPVAADAMQKVEVTGSRIKRAAAEGALPVTVVTRQQLEDSGSVTIAEFIRTSTFSTTGQFRPQSGSSAQSWSGANLRGLGSSRTLVLVDGRRVAKAPNVGDAADMNSIPMAAVERIEILTDGASAIYGSEAIGGVINIILRKDFDGVYVSLGKTNPDIKGGDRDEASALFGLTSEKGRIIAGVSRTSRDMFFTRDYPWGVSKGASSYSNSFYSALDDGAGGLYQGSTFLGNAGSCDFPDKGFYVAANGRCRYDFNLVAADEAATATKSVFARAEYNLSADFTAYLTASNTNNTSFGRYAPVPDSILVRAGSVNNLSTTPDQDVFLAHRFAAAGNRDTSTDGNLTDMAVGVKGTVAGFDIDVGARRTVSKIVETGRGFVVKGLATTAINNGTYNIVNPFANSDSVLKSITTTTGRDSKFAQSEIYATATRDLFAMAGGNSALYVGAEHRKEVYADLYDSLSEAGEVLGSSGNSAEGQREVDAISAEWTLPFTKTIEGNLAARYEKYSDYGSDFSPRASVRWAPTRAVTLRASFNRGFAAPSLPLISSKPSFSADSVIDPRHCAADGSYSAEDCLTEPFQINGLRIANPNLTSEKSKQFSFGGAWDVNQWLTVKADYWNTEIDEVLSFIDAQTLVNRDNGTDARPVPAGLAVRRDPATGAIVQVISGTTNEGTLKYSGLDAAATVTHRYASLGRFRHDLSWSHMFKAETNGVDFNGEFGQPKDRIQLNNSWAVSAFGLSGVDLAYNINLIGKNGKKNEKLRVGSYVTHDIQATYSPSFLKGLKLSVGAVNIGNKMPTLISDDSKPFNYDLYDAYGRQVYFRLEQRF
ncbi:MAG: iron complex outerrane recepter protein [Massilia sp.]|jgi:iron complex outermembrane receptor protein